MTQTQEELNKALDTSFENTQVKRNISNYASSVLDSVETNPQIPTGEPSGVQQ